MAEEQVSAAAAATAANPALLDHKRKLEDLEPEEDAPPEPEESPSELDEAGAKRPRLDEKPDVPASENGHKEENLSESVKEGDGDQEQPEEVSGEVVEEQPSEEAQQPPVQNPDGDDKQESQPHSPPAEEDRQLGDNHSTRQEQPSSDNDTVTRRMEIPNNKVGVLIGKAGDTIRYLQYNSGAKIQITKDVDSDPHSTTRAVEMIGTLDSVKNAEKLINAVIAEADAGGSPALVARGHGASQAAAEQIEIQVPNDKVGVIIGKGGETIKGMQTRSGARIQLIPQHLPDGDESKERTVRVTGDKRQIETAREMIKDVMSQPMRSSSYSGGYNQHGYRPRGPPHQWGSRGHPNSYDYQHQGPYSSHNQQQYPPPYRGYPPQMGPRGGFNSSWDQRPPSNMHQHGSGGYDYYGQRGHFQEPGPQHSAPPHAPRGHSNHSMGPPSHSNYNYGQHQGPDYGHQAPYSQSSHHQQGYSQGYDEHASQHHYGSSQQYPPPSGAPTNYGPPQQYGKPTYGMPPQAQPPQSYGPPRPNQPTEAPYQGSAPVQPYGQNVPPQQQPYPYASTGPTQPTYPQYGSTPAPATDGGYNQAQPAAGSGYPQQGYGQTGPQPTANYAQVGPTAAAYTQYPAQQGYTDQSTANAAAGYGYQGSQDAAAYGVAPATSSSYGAAAPAGQVVYTAQATTTQTQQGYDQSGGQQAGTYSAQPNTSVGYGGKTVSPQPQAAGYGQYDSSQMYTAPH